MDQGEHIWTGFEPCFWQNIEEKNYEETVILMKNYQIRAVLFKTDKTFQNITLHLVKCHVLTYKSLKTQNISD